MKSVFISSTFKDMQAERDYLHERVFPQIQRQLQALGETIQELDLRWGVDTSNMTEEESGKQVLKVCIDAIDRCKPYTIVLLGERYGWIPGISVIKEANDTRVNEHYQENMSITNLEIRYAALDDRELRKRCIFCFRHPAFLQDMGEDDRRVYDAESPMHRERLDRLKEEIRGLPDVKIIEYEVSWDPKTRQPTGMEAFGEQIFHLLSAMIQKELAGQKPRTLEEQAAVETIYRRERCLSSYIQRGREEYTVLHQAARYQRSQDKYSRQKWADTCLRGEAGSGKSALMASCAKRLEDNGERVILYFCGAPGCQNQNTLKRMMVWHLERILGSESTQGSYEERLGELNAKLGNRQVYCFLDGIDQMFPEGSELYLDVLSRCPQVYFILSAVSEFPVEALYEKTTRTLSCVNLGGLETFQIRQFIDATTKRRGKKLDDRLVDEILKKKEAENPLYLSLILQRFFMMEGREFRLAEELAPGMEGLHRYMSNLLAELPEGAEALTKTMLLTTGKRFGEGEFELILGLLAASRNGLTEEELEKILDLAGLPFSQLRFQQIVSYLYDAFQIQTDGKWDFTHRLFREALLQSTGIGEARQLLIQFALCDEAFMEREGFAYVLDARLPEGVLVLTRAKDFTRPECVCDYVAELLKRGGSTYFEEMLKEAAAEALADFWIRVFPGRDYGNACYAFQIRMCRKLLESGACAVRQDAEICIRLAQKALETSNFSDAENYLRQGEKAAAKIPEPERSLLLARLAFYRANSAAGQRMEDTFKLYEQAGNLAAAVTTKASGKLLEDAIYWRIRTRCAWIQEIFWQKKEILVQEAEKELTFLKLQQNQISEESYAESLLRLFRCQMELLRAQELAEEEKSAQAERVVKASTELADDFPSVPNLTLVYWILEDARKLREPEEQYPVCQMQIHYARRCTERRGAWNDRYNLMYSLLLYAYRADSVLMKRSFMQVEKGMQTRSAECWEEGFELLEQLLSEKENMSYLLRDAAYFYGQYCHCRLDLEGDEAKYPVILARSEKVMQMYEQAKAAGESVDGCDWLKYVRDAQHHMGTIYQKLHEDQKALLHLTEAGKAAWQVCELNPTAANLLEYLDILEWHMEACYRHRQDEQALQAAERLEQLLSDWQVTGGDYVIRILYVRGRIAYERGELSTAQQIVAQLEPYRERMKKKLLGDRCLLLALDTACAGADLPTAENAWSVAEEHLLHLWKENNHIRKHEPSLAAEIRYYLEYGYRRIVKLRTVKGMPVSSKEQEAWLGALDAPFKDWTVRREEKCEAERQSKSSAAEQEKEEWRIACQADWSDISAVMGEADTDNLLLYLELYKKQTEQDKEQDRLAYRLRKERQKLARELYLRTGDSLHIEHYLEETDRLISGYVTGGPLRFKDSGIHVFDCAKDWDQCAVNLLKELYEETRDYGWLTRIYSYLEQAMKRQNLSWIEWYVETFLYLEANISDMAEKERLQALRQRRYEREFDSLMVSYRISREWK